jgi:hypothetical protein
LPCIPTATGNYTITVNVIDGGGLNATASTLLAVTPAGNPGGPFVSAFLITPSSLVLGNSTNLTVMASGGGVYRSYAYSGLPPGCSPANASNLTCRPTSAGTYPVRVTVTGATGANVSVGSNLTVFPVGGGGSPAILAFVASPTAIVLGNSTTLTVLARANGTLSYRYAGLPPGCASVNTANLPCTPSSSGRYLIQAVVADTAGHQIGVFGVLTVTPSGVVGLAVAQFLAVPSDITLGHTLYLVVSATGGVGPLSYGYAGLPAGCATANRSSLNCTPTSVGSYNVTVTVSDALGRHVQAHQAINVLPSTVPPGGRGNQSALGIFGEFGGALVVVVGFTLGIAVTALAVEGYRRRRLAAEGQELVQQMSDPAWQDDEGP